MQVEGHKLTYNDRCSYKVRSAIQRKLYDLGLRLQTKIGEGYEVKTINSYYSEATYVHIYRGERKVIVGFRNHDNHQRSNADIYVNLADFKSWASFENVFFSRTVHRLLNELNKEVS